MQKLSKKGFSLFQVPTIIIVLVVIAVTLGVGATILDNIQDTQTAGSYASNVTGDGLAGLDSLSGWQSTWVVVIAAVVILGMIGLLYKFKQ